VRCADHEPGLGEPAVSVQLFRDAEVHERGAAARDVEHDVVRLDVAVDQPALVRMLQRLEDRSGDGERPLRGEGAAAEHVTERLALDERHRVVDEPLPLAHEVDGQDVRVLQPGDGASLVLEPLQHAGCPRHVGSQDLHGEPTLQLPVPDLVDFGEPPTADEGPDLVLRAESAGKPGFGVRVVGGVGHAGNVRPVGRGAREGIRLVGFGPRSCRPRSEGLSCGPDVRLTLV
jgi:hypothetical protein